MPAIPFHNSLYVADRYRDMIDGASVDSLPYPLISGQVNIFLTYVCLHSGVLDRFVDMVGLFNRVLWLFKYHDVAGYMLSSTLVHYIP